MGTKGPYDAMGNTQHFHVDGGYKFNMYIILCIYIYMAMDQYLLIPFLGG